MKTAFKSILMLLLTLAMFFSGPGSCPAAETPPPVSALTETFAQQGSHSLDNESRNPAPGPTQQVLEEELSAVDLSEDTGPDNDTGTAPTAGDTLSDNAGDIIHRAFEELAVAEQATALDTPDKIKEPPPAPDKPAEAQPEIIPPDTEPDQIAMVFDEFEALITQTAFYYPPSEPVVVPSPGDAIPVAPDEKQDVKPEVKPAGKSPAPPDTVPAAKEQELRKSYHENGNLRSVFTVTGGVLDGPARIYDEDGRLLVEAQYRQDVLEGVAKRYFADGVSWREERYQSGKLNGLCTTYISGRIRFIDSYKNGQKTNRKAYDDQGKLDFDQDYPHDG